MPDDIQGLVRDWRDVILRLQQMTRNDQGAAILRVQILCIRGQPAYWFEPEHKRIEPAAAARAFCEQLDDREIS